MDREKKRILQLITRSDWAGAQKVLYSLVYGVSTFYSEEFEVEVACGKENGMLISELEKLGVKVFVIPELVRELSPVEDLVALFKIYRLIRRRRYDVVHVHSSKAGLLGRIAARIAKVPRVIYTVHGWWPIEQFSGLRREVFVLVERIAARFCDKMVFLCRKDMDKAIFWKIGNESQYVVIPNAIIPIDTNSIKRGKLRRELGISENVKIVGNVARLDPPKNPVKFLEVAKGVLQKRKDVRFVWIGGNIYESHYGKFIKDWFKRNRALKQYIYFLDFRKDALELMADFDVLLISSDAEGLPLAILEARSLSVPVVSTNVGCVGEVISDVEHSLEGLVNRVLLMLNGNGSKLHRVTTQNDEEFKKFLQQYVTLFRGD